MTDVSYWTEVDLDPTRDDDACCLYEVEVTHDVDIGGWCGDGWNEPREYHYDDNGARITRLISQETGEECRCPYVHMTALHMVLSHPKAGDRFADALADVDVGDDREYEED
jgi:hypothetical protein